MLDFKAEFVGGSHSGEVISPMSEAELNKLGYRVHLRGTPSGDEMPVYVVVPIEWSADEAHRAILQRWGNRRR